MRLVYTTNREERATQLAAILEHEGIDCKVEGEISRSWESHQYGDRQITIWTIDEEDFERAAELVELYETDPDFFKSKNIDFPSPTKSLNDAMKTATEPEVIAEVDEAVDAASGRQKRVSATYVTWYILFICALVFFWDHFHLTRHSERTISDLPYAPLVTSPVKRQLMYDYPTAFGYLEKVIQLYSSKNGDNLESLTAKRTALERQFADTPWWQGIYPMIVDIASGHPEEIKTAPICEKIREGEVWRILSPIFLHFDIFHIAFNMIWLIVLGSQIEWRLGPLRYLALIAITGIASNTAQYTMSGPTFLGYSGVLCGMLGFIWARQRLAPWEGYQLDSRTRSFLFFMLLAMLLIQCAGFVVELSTGRDFGIAIANTAHISGGVAGYFLGRLPLFARSG